MLHLYSLLVLQIVWKDILAQIVSLLLELFIYRTYKLVKRQNFEKLNLKLVEQQTIERKLHKQNELKRLRNLC